MLEKVMEKLDLDMTDIDVKPCIHDDNYLIYSNGMIYSCKSEKFMTPNQNGKNSKYLCFLFYNRLRKSKVQKHYLHRLVAEHFLPNPNNFTDVHHIDNNPRNNNVNNLQWMSHKENCKLKIHTRSPFKEIERNDMAYLCDLKNDDYIKFTYRGGYNNAPKIMKYFKTIQEAKQFRDEFFETYREVA